MSTIELDSTADDPDYTLFPDGEGRFAYLQVGDIVLRIEDMRGSVRVEAWRFGEAGTGNDFLHMVLNEDRTVTLHRPNTLL